MAKDQFFDWLYLISNLIGAAKSVLARTAIGLQHRMTSLVIPFTAPPPTRCQ